MPESPPRRAPATSVKVAVTGPHGVGTTTLIRTLSEIDVLTTERRAPLVPGRDEPATVPMDFGRLTIDEDLHLYLFGIPGQEPPEPVWPVLEEGLLGIVALVDDRADRLREAVEVLTWVRDRADVPHVVGVNRVAPGDELRSVRQARHQLRIPDDVHVVAVDTRDRASAKALLIELFSAAREHEQGGA